MKNWNTFCNNFIHFQILQVKPLFIYFNNNAGNWHLFHFNVIINCNWDAHWYWKFINDIGNLLSICSHDHCSSYIQCLHILDTKHIYISSSKTFLVKNPVFSNVSRKMHWMILMNINISFSTWPRNVNSKMMKNLSWITWCLVMNCDGLG